MNKQETVKILATLEAHTPHQFEKINNKVKENILDLWAARFIHDDYKIVYQAVLNYIDNDIRGFIPTIGAIKDEVRKIQYPDELTEIEAFAEIYKRIGDKYPTSKEAFNSLPVILQKVVASPSQLKEWGMMQTETVQSVISSHIQRTYRSVIEKEREKQRTGQVAAITESERLIEQKEEVKQIDKKICEKDQALEFIRKAMEANREKKSFQEREYTEAEIEDLYLNPIKEREGET